MALEMASDKADSGSSVKEEKPEPHHWMYHATEKSPRLFAHSVLARAEKDGWVDNPAKLPQYVDPITAPIAPVAQQHASENAGPVPYQDASDEDLMALYREKTGRSPHPMAKRETLIRGIEKAALA